MDDQQFVMGFLASCADRGLSPQQAEELAAWATARLDKTAAETVAAKLMGVVTPKTYTDLVANTAAAGNKVLELAERIGKWPLIWGTLGLGGALAGGYHAGRTLAKAQDTDLTPEDIRTQEYIAALHRNATQMRYQAGRAKAR